MTGARFENRCRLAVLGRPGVVATVISTSGRCGPCLDFLRIAQRSVVDLPNGLPCGQPLVLSGVAEAALGDDDFVLAGGFTADGQARRGGLAGPVLPDDPGVFTRAELTEHGYDALTVDAVAARTGVHRTTVYRRWHDVGGLIGDVFTEASDQDWRPRDTGSLRGDLAALNQEIQDSLTEEPSIAAALIVVSFRSEDAARALRWLWEDRYTQCESSSSERSSVVNSRPTSTRTPC